MPRLGVPYLEMHDGPAGVSYTEDTTNPPQHQMLAATWDEESAYNFGDIEGSEAAAMGANAQFARVAQNATKMDIPAGVKMVKVETLKNNTSIVAKNTTARRAASIAGTYVMDATNWYQDFTSCTSFTIEEMHIKTTMRYHLIPVRRLLSKKTKTTSVGEDVEKLDSFHTVGGSPKRCSYSGK